MNPDQLKRFQSEMRSFYKMYETLVQYWNGEHLSYPHVTALMVLVQNLQFDGTNTMGYSHKDTVDKVLKIEECIEAMRDYYKDDYMVKMAADEVTFALTSLRYEEITKEGMDEKRILSHGPWNDSDKVEYDEDIFVL